jgi:hypothetical protein
MFLRILALRPFTRMQNVYNPEYNKIAKSILEDIHFFISLEKLFYPNKKPIYNTKPILKIFNSPDDYSQDKITILEHKNLIKLCNSYLVDNYYRDLTVYDRQNEILIARCWINYNQKERFLKIVNIYETIDYQKDIGKYIKFIDNTKCVPNFEDNKEFLHTLRHFQE